MDGLHLGPTLNGDLLPLEVAHVPEQDLLPVTTVADEAQVGQWPLRWPHLLLHLGQQVACGTEHHRHITHLPTDWRNEALPPPHGGGTRGGRSRTEVDEHLAEALPHVLRHGQDARHVVVQEGVLLLQQNKTNKKFFSTSLKGCDSGRLVSSTC